MMEDDNHHPVEDNEEMGDDDSELSRQSWAQEMMNAMEDGFDDDEEEIDEEDKMMVTHQERSWALELKERARQNPQHKPLSDLGYAQFAIACHGNLELALLKMEHLQLFCDMYRVDNTPAQGSQILDAFYQLQPQCLLGVDLNPGSGEGVIALDTSKNFPSVAFEIHPTDTVREQNWRIHAVACYYILRTVQPDLQSIRQGIILLCESTGMNWANLDMNYEQRLQSEMWGNYPMVFHQWRIYNTSLVATIFWNVVKKLFPKDCQRKLQLGCDVDPTCDKRRTLGDLFLLPTPELAHQRIVARARELLEQRCRNEQSFQL